MSAPQTPPPCPACGWCAQDHGTTDPAELASVPHYSLNYVGAGKGDAYIILAKQPEDAVTTLSISVLFDVKAPIMQVTAAEARMLASIARPEVATALREAADELDRITSGGTS